MGEPVVVLAPHVGGEQVGEARHRCAPGDTAGDLEPLGVLVEHGVDDVDERLVAIEQSMAPCEQITLQPALAAMLREDLDHPAAGGQVVVRTQPLALPGPVGHLEESRQVIGRGLIGSEDAESAAVGSHHVP